MAEGLLNAFWRQLLSQPGNASTEQPINENEVCRRIMFSGMTISPAGVITITGSLFIGGASSVGGNLALTGGQITFPATQSPSADPNTLDDYEEGTWTPAVGGTATYTTQTGTYTKVGRQVHIAGFLTINAIGSGSTSQINGLPFPTGTLTAGTVGYWAALVVAPVWVGCYANGSSIVFTGLTAANASATNPFGVLGNSSQVAFAVSYGV